MEFEFLLTNSSGDAIQGAAFTEITLDYSDFGGKQFKWIYDISQDQEGNFSIPLILDASADVDKIEIFSNQFAPKKTSLSASTIQTISNNNYNSNYPYEIELNTFSPNGVNETFNESEIFMDMIKNTDECNVPNYNRTACSFLPSDEQSMENFEPLSVVMGGASLTFVMGKIDNNSPTDPLPNGQGGILRFQGFDDQWIL